MASFGNVTSVVERPVGTTLQTAGTIGASSIVVDDISRLTWPAGGLRIGTQQMIYSIDAAPDQTVDTVDIDEDDPGSDEVGTITLGGTLSADYDVDEPVVQFQESVVTERVATVLLPGEMEELVLRVPRHLWDRLPADIRDRDAASETVALEDVEGEWVMTDVIDEDPSVDASFVNTLTLPQSTGGTICNTGGDQAGLFDEAWTAAGNITANDGVYAHAVGTSATAAVISHTTSFRLASVAADGSGVGSVAWGDIDGALDIGTTASASLLATGTSHYLELTDFGFSIPVGATITGVVVQINHGHTGGVVVDSTVKLVKGGAITGTDQASGANWPNELQSLTYGGTSDMWGLALTPADVNASDFGVVLSATASGALLAAFVDYIRIKVSYTTTSTTSFRSNTHFIEGRNYNFAIPDEAVITGITAEVERHASNDSGDDYVRDNQVRLTNGTDSSNDYSTGIHWPTTDAIATYGGDLWGLPWTTDDINSANFGVLVSADVNFGSTAYIDFIRVTVAYVTAGDA